MVESYRDFSITISNRFTFIVIASISSPSIFDISIARLKIYVYIYISIRQWHVFGENCISETRISRGSFVNRGELFARRACYRPNFQSMSRINILGGAVDNLSLT